VGGSDLQLAHRAGGLGVVAAPRGADLADQAFAPRAVPDGLSLIDSEPRSERRAGTRTSPPEASEKELTPTRLLDYLLGTLMGAGLPIGLALLAAPHDQSTRGSAPTFNLTIIGVAVAYLLLWLAVSRHSARVRARAQARRMREPWARGKDEWQPSGWTYNRLEEVLVAAALSSALTCTALLMTIGGFLG
jgi:hypothetical protein